MSTDTKVGRRVNPAVGEVGAGAPPDAANGQDVNALIRYALDRDVPVETLERLVGLQERVLDRQAETELAHALAEFQEACPEIPKVRTATVKTRSGGHFSYSYAALDDIARAIRPLLPDHGLSYWWDSETGDGYVTAVCHLQHVAGASRTARFQAPTESDARMSGAQAAAAALTYAKRQSLVAVLGLTTADDDTDGASVVGAATITEAQAADLQVLIDEVGADRVKFLRYLGFGSLEKIPQSEYQRAVSMLEAKRSAS